MASKTMRKQFADTMLEVGVKDSNLVVLVGDISHFILQPFAMACPGRYFNVGICEQTIISMAAGLAKVGFSSVAHTIAPFIIERAFEQIKLDFCYHQLGGNLITVGSAFDYSNLGCTHHCYNDFALLKTLPNTQLFYPATPIEFDLLFRQNYQSGKLNLFRIPEKQHNIEFSGSDICTGKGIKVKEGTNLTIITTGSQLLSAVESIGELENQGYDVELIYIHTIRPLDTDLICTSVNKTKRVLVVEEHMQSGGMGDDILRAINGIEGVKFSSLAIPDRFVTEYGSYEEHCEALGLSPNGIIRKIRDEDQNAGN